MWFARLFGGIFFHFNIKLKHVSRGPWLKSLFQMMKPVQLIETGSSASQLKLIRGAFELIKNEGRPVTAISIIGPAR